MKTERLLPPQQQMVKNAEISGGGNAFQSPQAFQVRDGQNLRQQLTDLITGIFQPHLYTRTRDFAADFAKALSSVDKLILLDIYPAREEPIEGVTSEIIFDKVTIADKVLLKKEQLMEYLENEPIDALITFGAGNIDRFVEPITEMLRKRV